MLGVFNKDTRQVEREREQAREERLSALPTAVRQWLERLEKDGRRDVLAIRKEAESRLKPLEAEAAKLQAQIDALTAELAEAELWLTDIPEDADSRLAVERYSVSQLWPGRIDALRARLGETRAHQAAIERDKNRALDKTRNELRLIILDAAKRLESIELDILG